MSSRLNDIPIFETSRFTITAENFNRVHIALNRLHKPLLLPLPGLRTLELILDDDAWIVTDRSLNDIPVIAWLDFELSDRGLHEPVNCRLNLYHAHGRLIIDKVLVAMKNQINHLLNEKFPQEKGKIIPIQK